MQQNAAALTAHTSDPGNTWNLTTSSVVEILPRKKLEELTARLAEWARVYPRAGTWVEQTYDVPSLFVRIDFSDAGVYEFEDKPCGLGICCASNPDFSARLAHLRQEWPKFGWVQGERRKSDDRGWLGEPTPLEKALDSKGLFLIRCMPEQVEYTTFNDRSVSTIANEGDKSYGEPMGLWQIVRPNGNDKLHPALPSQGVPFCIKPVQGTRNRGVAICLNGATEVRAEGGRQAAYLHGEKLLRSDRDLISLTQAERCIRKWGAAVCQPFVKPLRLAHVPDRNVLLRCYFGWSPDRGRWIALGGLWLASPALRVHGEEGVIIGPLVLH